MDQRQHDAQPGQREHQVAVRHAPRVERRNREQVVGVRGVLLPAHVVHVGAVAEERDGPERGQKTTYGRDQDDPAAQARIDAGDTPCAEPDHGDRDGPPCGTGDHHAESDHDHAGGDDGGGPAASAGPLQVTRLEVRQQHQRRDRCQRREPPLRREPDRCPGEIPERRDDRQVRVGDEREQRQGDECRRDPTTHRVGIPPGGAVLTAQEEQHQHRGDAGEDGRDQVTQDRQSQQRGAERPVPARADATEDDRQVEK